MKIAFSGTQCVGKTTTLNLIKSTFKEDGTSDEFPMLNHHTFGGSKTHELLGLGLNLNKEANDLSQTILLANYLKDVVTPNLISDRCILDNLVYTWYQWYYGNCTTDLYELTSNLCYEYIEKYDYVFYFPPEIPIIGNGIRDEDESYRSKLHNKFIWYINELKDTSNVYTIAGHPNDKVKQIKEILDNGKS